MTRQRLELVRWWCDIRRQDRDRAVREFLLAFVAGLETLRLAVDELAADVERLARR